MAGRFVESPVIALQLDPLAGTPLYLQIVEQIEEAVRTDSLQEGQTLWSARKIASHHHISYQTAERALAELARRGWVLRSVAGGTVIRKRPERSVRRQVTHRVIALIQCWEIGGLKPTYTMAEMEMLLAAAQTLSASLWGFVSFSPGSGDIPGGFSVAKLAEWCRQVKFDGALVFGNMPTRGLEWLDQQGVPVVLADSEPDSPLARVVHDNYGGMRAAVEHLIALGHTRIAFLRGDRPYHYGVRQQAYLDCLCEAGLQADPELMICLRRPKLTVEDAVDCWTALPEERRPTAIAAGADILAAMVLKSLQERGRRIPEDMSLIGYDDEPFSLMLDPPLTTLHVSWTAMGQAAAKLMLELLSEEEAPVKAEAGAPRRVVIPASLIVRGSSGQRSGTVGTLRNGR